MSDIATAIYSRLTAEDTATQAIVSDRIYPHRSPPAASSYPLVAYQPQQREYEETLSGPVDLAYQDVSVACIAETYDGALTLANAVIADLHRQSGTWGGVEVLGAFHDSNGEQLDAEPVDNGLYVCDLTFSLSFRP